ncbi:MAG: hypothetical protein WD768_10825 [Phycisphaeraceae bacterium]
MDDPSAQLGLTRDELRNLLGNPTDRSVPPRRRRESMIWKYGEIEYHFGLDGKVWLIYTESPDGTPQVLAQSASEGNRG